MHCYSADPRHEVDMKMKIIAFDKVKFVMFDDPKIHLFGNYFIKFSFFVAFVVIVMLCGHLGCDRLGCGCLCCGCLRYGCPCCGCFAVVVFVVFIFVSDIFVMAPIPYRKSSYYTVSELRGGGRHTPGHTNITPYRMNQPTSQISEYCL